MRHVVMISGMTKTKSTFGNAVAKIRYRLGGNSLARALDLCQGLQGISSYTQILNKREGISWGIPTKATIRSKFV